MRFWRRSQRRGARVRLLSAERLIGNVEKDGESFNRYGLAIEIRTYDGESGVVDRKLWVPAGYSPESIARSGRELSAVITGEGFEEIEIYWHEVDAELSQADFTRLFHKQGPVGERLELLEQLNERGFFTREQYENGKRDLLAERGEQADVR